MYRLVCFLHFLYELNFRDHLLETLGGEAVVGAVVPVKAAQPFELHGHGRPLWAHGGGASLAADIRQRTAGVVPMTEALPAAERNVWELHVWVQVRARGVLVLQVRPPAREQRAVPIALAEQVIDRGVVLVAN